MGATERDEVGGKEEGEDALALWMSPHIISAFSSIIDLNIPSDFINSSPLNPSPSIPSTSISISLNKSRNKVSGDIKLQKEKAEILRWVSSQSHTNPILLHFSSKKKKNITFLYTRFNAISCISIYFIGKIN